MISETDIGDYEIIKGGVLGTGAFATVWKGRAKKDHSKLVAIKAIKKKNFLKSQQLLSKEITILKELSSLHHRNVVGLLDCVELKDDVCLVMEYCNGGDLADCLHRNGTLSEDTLCAYVKQIAEAMKALQQKGIVHRDLKPQNILLCYEGPKYPHPSEMHLKIADFGFARFIIGAEMATTLCGSPMYMAPEVIMSVKYSAKADLWSIGTILYQCLTGRAPFQAQNPQELKKKYEKSPGLKPNIPSSTSPELRDLLMRMLKRDADERIDFGEFFNHPFLKKAGPVKVSKPVSVPRRRSSSSSESSTPGRSPRASPRNRSSKMSSPARSPKVVAAAAHAAAQAAKEEEMTSTLTAAAGFTKVEKEDVRPTATGRSTPEDFVMVPEHIGNESDGITNAGVVVKAPLAEEEIGSFGSIIASTTPSPHRSPKAVHIRPGEGALFNNNTPATTTTTTTTTTKDNKNKPSTTKTTVINNIKSPPKSRREESRPTQHHQHHHPHPHPGSPSRPVTLAMEVSPTTTTTPSQSQPITVPASSTVTAASATAAARGVGSEVKTGRRVDGTGDDSPVVIRRKIKSPNDVKMESDSTERTVACRTPDHHRLSGVDAVDAGSFSPPAVQFCVGTPPNAGSGPSWKRSSVVTPPPYSNTTQGSPHRRSSVGSPHLTPLQISNNSGCSSTTTGTQMAHPPSLPTILGSPNKMPTMFHLTSPQHDNSPEQPPVHAPFSAGNFYNTANTVPDNLMALARHRDGDDNCKQHGYHRVSTDSSLLSHQNRQGIMIPYAGSRERVPSSGSERDCQFYGSPLERDRSPTYRRRHSSTGGPNSSVDLASPSSVPTHPHPHLAQSPGNTDPLRFVPQPLLEETLMDDNHNETLGKLTFVLDLVECILDLARTLGSAFRSFDPSEAKKVENLSPDHYSQYRSSQRSLEQLVLYARACQLLNSALHMARDELRNDRLQHSTNLRNVLSEMNTYYHHVVDKCKNIHKEFSTSCRTPLTQKLVMATADKLIYNQAIQLCQSAALDEFSKTTSPDIMAEVVRRYQVAQILLHSLAQTARNDNDKHMLIKYRKSVESRLSILTDSGHFDGNYHRLQQHLHHNHHHQQQQHHPHLVDNCMYHIHT